MKAFKTRFNFLMERVFVAFLINQIIYDYFKPPGGLLLIVLLC